MSGPLERQQELLEFCGALRDGQMTADGFARLEQLLSADAAARQFYIRFMTLHCLLEQGGAAREASEPLVRSPVGSTIRTAATAQRAALPALMALAASLLVAVGIFYVWRQSSDALAALPLASLEQVQGEVYVLGAGGKTVAQPGQRLFAGQGLQVVEEESSAVVIYADGTRLEIGAGTTIGEFSGGQAASKRVVLTEGYLRADVAPQPTGQPMLLTTPQADVVVLGTKFILSGGEEATYVETKEGAVQLTRKHSGRASEVRAGNYEVVTGAVEPMEPQPLPPLFDAPQLTLEGYWTADLSPDGQTLAATRFMKGGVELWDTATGQMRIALEGHTQRVFAAAYSPDGQTLASASRDGTIRLWNVATGQLEATLGDQSTHYYSLAFSADGQTLATRTSEAAGQSVALWNLRTGEGRTAFTDPTAKRWTFSADGQTAATSSSDHKTVTLWDVATGEKRATLRGFKRVIFGLAFSRDGETLAIYTSSGLVTLWDLAAAEVSRSFQAIGGKVVGLTFSPDGATLATGHQDAKVRLWDIATGKQLAAFEGQKGQLRVLSFSRDGETLLTSEDDGDGTIRLWNVPPRAP